MLDLLYASKETSVQLVAMGLVMLLVGRYWKAVCTKKAQGNPEEPPADTFSPSLNGHKIHTAIERPGTTPRNYGARGAERNSKALPAHEIGLAGRNLPPVPST